MPVAQTAFDAHDPPARELLDDCVHCGFCLPACPTYQLWGQEADSPRGRILLMDAAVRGELPLTPDLVRHWDACLGCMACVPACPSGVRYDRLIEQTRQQVERRHRRAPLDRARRAAVFALSAYGSEVEIPPGQGCCGALELHGGRQAAAQRRATRLLDVLGDDPETLVAVNSAGCGSVLKDYGSLLGTARANALAARVRDVSEILAELGPPAEARRLHPLALRVAYHDACHLAHAQGIREQPRHVLAQVPQLQLVALAEADLCCGSAGTYNLVQPDAAADLGRRKAEHVRAPNPDAPVAANPWCMLP